MNDVVETLDKLMNTSFGVSMLGKYKNTIQMNGWIIQQPKIVVNELSKKECISFVFYQVEKNKTGIFARSFNAVSYNKRLIHYFKETPPHHIFFIAFKGKIIWKPVRANYMVEVIKFKIDVETNIKILPPYKRKEEYGESEINK